jgi:hypothetical protein
MAKNESGPGSNEPSTAPSTDVKDRGVEQREEGSGGASPTARRAYERYLARGAEHGRDQEDWYEAEREDERQHEE